MPRPSKINGRLAIASSTSDELDREVDGSHASVDRRPERSPMGVIVVRRDQSGTQYFGVNRLDGGEAGGELRGGCGCLRRRTSTAESAGQVVSWSRFQNCMELTGGSLTGLGIAAAVRLSHELRATSVERWPVPDAELCVGWRYTTTLHILSRCPAWNARVSSIGPNTFLRPSQKSPVFSGLYPLSSAQCEYAL